MSGGEACKDKTHRTAWRVTQLRQNHSAFNGYHPTPSDYSEIICPLDHRQTGDNISTSTSPRIRRWRTKADYVDTIELEEWT